MRIGVFAAKLALVPLAEASRAGEDLRVPYAKARVKGAPRVDADGELSEGEEAALYAHYGLDYGDEHSYSGLPERRDERFDATDTSADTSDDAMTRSEEELQLASERRVRGRARLRKYVVTEHVTQTVPVSHEEVRLETEPVTDASARDATAGPEISEAEHELTLHEQRPVVDKQVVAKERVRMTTDTVTGEQQISDELRKERIDTDTDTDTDR